jgi:hypothetical protein
VNERQAKLASHLSTSSEGIREVKIALREPVEPKDPLITKVQTSRRAWQDEHPKPLPEPKTTTKRRETPHLAV